MSEQQSGEKTEDATPRKRQEARKKGTVAKSTDLVGACGLLVAAIVMPSVVKGIGAGFWGGMAQTMGEIPHDLHSSSVLKFTGEIAKPLALASLPIFGVLMVVGLLVNFGQVGFVLSGESLKPSFSKINPGAGLKRLFSRRSVVEGLKASSKFALFSWICFAAIASEWQAIINLGGVAPSSAASAIGAVLQSILTRVAVVWMIVAIADYLYQRKEVEKQLKMTKDELRREMKEQEGSPEVKSALFHQRRKLLKGGMAKTLQEADVLITNPTHFAIAIKYKRNEMHAPMVLAKGQDFLALKMREIAAQHGIPIVENKPLARALYKQCEPGDFVPRDFFVPVAEVLAFVFKTAKSAKKSA